MQCSSRNARVDPEVFSRDPYSDSILQIRLKSRSVCPDCDRARIYTFSPSSLYKVLEPEYMVLKRPAAFCTLSSVEKENRRSAGLTEAVFSTDDCSLS